MSLSSYTPASEARGLYRSYVTGFVLAILLTAIPFWLVMEKIAPRETLLPAILVIAAVQMLVHLKYFFHLTGADRQWNLSALLLTGIIITIVFGGTFWVMLELDRNMMPWMYSGTHQAASPAVITGLNMEPPGMGSIVRQATSSAAQTH
jgi:cytochrome o ubiquinol oxidase operon protein cyoD